LRDGLAGTDGIEKKGQPDLRVVALVFALAIGTLFLFLLVLVWAWWVDRHRQVRTLKAPS